MAYQHIKLPSGGDKIRVRKDFSLEVPDRPIIPYIEGDGTGVDITPVMIKVVDAAVAKAYGGKRKIAWQEVLAGQKAFDRTGTWLPDDGSVSHTRACSGRRNSKIPPASLTSACSPSPASASLASDGVAPASSGTRTSTSRRTRRATIAGAEPRRPANTSTRFVPGASGTVAVKWPPLTATGRPSTFTAAARGETLPLTTADESRNSAMSDGEAIRTARVSMPS